MRFSLLPLFVLCFACACSGAEDPKNVGGAIGNIRSGPRRVPKQDLSKAFDIEETKPANLNKAFDIEETKPANLNKAFDIEETKPADLNKAFDIEETKPADLNKAFDIEETKPVDSSKSQAKIPPKPNKAAVGPAAPGGATPGGMPTVGKTAKPFSPEPVH